jgi:hypothetical protein
MIFKNKRVPSLFSLAENKFRSSTKPANSLSTFFNKNLESLVLY